MIGKGACVFALSVVSTLLCSNPEARAAGQDGEWSMIAETTRGHCGVIYMGLAINRGRVSSTSGSFAFYPIKLAGRISNSGQARMNVVAGPRTAQGTGRFNRYRGSGTWAGKGPSGLCSGVWNATHS